MKTFEEIVLELHPDIHYDSDKLTVVQAQRAATKYASQIIKQNSEYTEALREAKKELEYLLTEVKSARPGSYRAETTIVKLKKLL